MRISNAFSLVAIFCSLGVVITAQSGPAAPTGAPAVQAAAPSAPAAASRLLRPALDEVQQAVGAIKVEKWKKGTVRDEAPGHISAILRDLNATLPPLLDTADAAPETLSKVLPVSRNAAALYDVLLSVVEAARVSGSPEEVARLEQALASLGSARDALDDQLQASAAGLEKQEIDLRTTLKARDAVQCPAAPTPAKPVCPAPGPVRRKRTTKPPAKPAQPSTSPANATPKKLSTN